MHIKLTKLTLPHRYAGLLDFHFRVFRLSVVKPKPKLSQRPIRTKVNITRSQSELKVNTSNRPEARENASDQVATGFSFASDWLRGWREFSRPITGRSKAKPVPDYLTFDTQLKIALCLHLTHPQFRYLISPTSAKIFSKFSIAERPIGISDHPPQRMLCTSLKIYYQHLFLGCISLTLESEIIWHNQINTY